ncbi:unnamed protein product [Citrullus colocynthis]|uniref:RNase H type-1 domain-containing protein n=1 Tax=Citrullus colocynthis TaxID=252529 RepID=A0ABP0YXH1_9ROSI
MRLFLSRGQCSVKSGYKVAMLLYKHSSTRLWSSKIPSKCVNVPWRQQCMPCLVAIEPNKTILPLLGIFLFCGVVLDDKNMSVLSPFSHSVCFVLYVKASCRLGFDSISSGIIVMDCTGSVGAVSHNFRDHYLIPIYAEIIAIYAEIIAILDGLKVAASLRFDLLTFFFFLSQIVKDTARRRTKNRPQFSDEILPKTEQTLH